MADASSETGTSTDASSTQTSDSTETSTSNGDGDGDPATGDGDGDPATGDGDGDPTTGDGDGDPTTGDGDGDPTTGDGDGDGDGDTMTGDGDGDEPPPCDEMMGVVTYSYIWIANSSEGTVSKINTETLEEEGRYITRPDGGGSPSRTSVNTSGDVVVASRSGGLTKIEALSEDCPDVNGIPGVQTSTGPNDVLPWGEDECVVWHLPLDYADNRPVAWTPGIQNPQSCAWEDQKVWTSASQNQNGTIDVMLVDGQSGALEQTLNLPDVPVQWYTYGGYGAAVDGSGDLWMTTLGDRLVHVALDDLSYEVFAIPARSYGMTYDAFGHVWACEQQLSRFDTESETWESFTPASNSNNIHRGGCMADAEGRLWKANGTRVSAFDVDTLELVDEVDTGVADIWGVSIDFNGYVWAIPRGGTQAFRIDPDTHDIETVNGLVGAYTYSDMTGTALFNIAPQ